MAQNLKGIKGMDNYNSGWYNENMRHSMASKGIKSGRKSKVHPVTGTLTPEQISPVLLKQIEEQTRRTIEKEHSEFDKELAKKEMEAKEEIKREKQQKAKEIIKSREGVSVEVYGKPGFLKRITKTLLRPKQKKEGIF